ncbi:unnamed protein product [Rotaria socialis]|uniref:GH16 domain-containing protein n=2 Tax=Rotaria socialis TaxID=392032 RepID=A0A821SJ37_9BILA|nr:unnamed protein product [Rotaria socialis]
MEQILIIIGLIFVFVISVHSIHKPFIWSGYDWHIRHVNNSGPGPNNWNRNNVRVDTKHRLHLQMNHSPETGGWNCAELYTNVNLGYGTYRWKVQGRIDHFDRNVVLGLFLYNGPDGSNEIDIEVAKWGENITQPKNLCYTVYPRNASGPHRVSGHKRFSLQGLYSTHRFTWAPNKVTFGSQHGFYNSPHMNQIFAYETPSTFHPAIPETLMPVHMNLWAFKGHSPINKKNVEVIIHEFAHIPA